MSVRITLQLDVAKVEKLEALLDQHPNLGKLSLPPLDLHVHSSCNSSPEACLAADQWLERRGGVEFQPFFGPDEAEYGAGYWDDRRGASALVIYCFFRREPQITERVCAKVDHPLDAEDIGRCLQLLDIVPEWRERIHELSVISPAWAGIAKNWETIESAYRSGDMAEATRRLARSLNSI